MADEPTNNPPRISFRAFKENRLALTIRMRDSREEPAGVLRFMTEPRARGEEEGEGSRVPPICSLAISLPLVGGGEAEDGVVVEEEEEERVMEGELGYLDRMMMTGKFTTQKIIIAEQRKKCTCLALSSLYISLAMPRVRFYFES